MADQISAKAAAAELASEGILTQQAARTLGENDRQVQMPQGLGSTLEDPVFSCFLIDQSGSMDPHRQTVIDKHPLLLDALRGSRSCRKNALYVVQYMFSDVARLLHPFRVLSTDGKDQVLLLDANTYVPGGQTALYRTLYCLLQEVAGVIAHTVKQGIPAQFTVGVLTDGEDNVGEVEPGEIREVVRQLTDQSYLRSSVILGLTNTDLSEEALEDLRARVGFEKAIALSNTARDIRRAFELFSQSAVAVQIG